MSLTITPSGRRGDEPCCVCRARGDRIGHDSSPSKRSGRVTGRALEEAQVLVPTSRDEAVEAFGEGSDVTVLAGGTIVMPELNYGRLRPKSVLLLQKAGLSGIRRDGSRLTIGAMTTVAELEQAPEPLASAARLVADHEIRGQATLGGNLCAPPGKTPRGDLQAALIALGATVRSAGRDGERSEPIDDFLAGGPDGRLLLEVEAAEPQRAGFASVRRPHAHAYTVLAVCAAESADGIRVGVTGAGPRGLRALAVERAVAEGASSADAAEKVLDDAQPHDDALASAWYRRRLLPVIVRRALDDLEGGQ
jgi:aerobic carbon-monoxide dehydrogenase medium subunit